MAGLVFVPPGRGEQHWQPQPANGWVELLTAPGFAGAPLVHEVPGRAGWELRGVVQGGLRILERIERSGHACLQVRPTLGVFDLPILAWRALRMRASTAQLVGESA